MKEFFKRSDVTVGLAVGAVLSLAVAGSLDLFLPLETPGGWMTAAEQSLRVLLGPPWDRSLLLRIILLAAGLALTALLGALLGALFAVLISGFFRRLFALLDRFDPDGP